MDYGLWSPTILRALHRWQGFIQALFWRGNFRPKFRTSPKKFDQIYYSIKNPVIAVSKRAAVIQV